ncbi:MAG TPA: hypothetical protein V6D47_09420 [Oscillatoriaceae cyanobacterium]
MLKQAHTPVADQSLAAVRRAFAAIAISTRASRPFHPAFGNGDTPHYGL